MCKDKKQPLAGSKPEFQEDSQQRAMLVRCGVMPFVLYGCQIQPMSNGYYKAIRAVFNKAIWGTAVHWALFLTNDVFQGAVRTILESMNSAISGLGTHGGRMGFL